MTDKNWYEAWGFVENPYAAKPPEKIDPERFVWDRPDLPEAKEKLESFLKDVESGELTGILAFGDVGSGKTWLNQFIQKQISKRLQDVLIVETMVPTLQSDFKAVYGIFITHLLSDRCPFKKKLLEENESIDDFVGFFDNEDLGRALYHICTKDGNHIISRNWLMDLSVSTTDLRKADISTKIGENYVRIQIMEDILSNSLKIFSNIVFCADQLENSGTKFARQLSDGLRNIMDSLGEKLAMCCFFQAQDADEWYQMGYSGPLFTRLRHRILLSPLSAEHISDFLRLHSKAYRQDEFEVDDDIFPFTETGAQELVRSMKPERAFPRSIFHNCNCLARKAFERQAKAIDDGFVRENLASLDQIADQKQL